MANDIKNWAKRQKVGDRNAKVILLEIADVANADGYSWYAIPTIAETLEANPRTVERGIAYLVEKGFITRTSREKKSGKFTSKGTQINIPADDWTDILELRILRQKPYDKMADGEPEPYDNMSVTDENHPTNCPKPYDKLSTGQIVGQYNKNKELILEPSEEPKESEDALALAPVSIPTVTDNFQNYAFLMNFDFFEIHAHFFADKHKLETNDKQVIKNRIIDKRAWIEALIFWNENNYSPKSIGKQCDKYDEKLIERVKKQNANNKKHNETERERREREAFERIEFDSLATELLENEGIIQVGGV